MALDDLNTQTGQYHLLQALEAERQQFAQHLHDHVLDQLKLILAQTNAYEQSIRGHPQATMAFSVLSSLVRQLLQQTRDLEENLHPTVLQTLGLQAALERLTTQQERANGLKIHLELPRLQTRLAPYMELLLFRLAQSEIEHAFRQAIATRIDIVLRVAENELVYRIAHNGKPYPSPSLAMILPSLKSLGAIWSMDSQPDTQTLTVTFQLQPPIALTEREIDVLLLLSKGYANRQIADQLFITVRTVKFHLDNIYSKLGVTRRTEAIVLALRMGWLQKPD